MTQPSIVVRLCFASADIALTSAPASGRLLLPPGCLSSIFCCPISTFLTLDNALCSNVEQSRELNAECDRTSGSKYLSRFSSLYTFVLRSPSAVSKSLPPSSYSGTTPIPLLLVEASFALLQSPHVHLNPHHQRKSNAVASNRRVGLLICSCELHVIAQKSTHELQTSTILDFNHHLRFLIHSLYLCGPLSQLR